MASGPTNEAVNNFLKGSVTGDGWTDYTTPFKLALETVAGSASAAGTEVTGASYARASLSTDFGTPSGGSVTSDTDVSFTAMPGVTVVAVAIYDSAGTAARTWYGGITSKTTNAGDTLTFSSGNITAAITSGS